MGWAGDKGHCADAAFGGAFAAFRTPGLGVPTPSPTLHGKLSRRWPESSGRLWYSVTSKVGDGLPAEGGGEMPEAGRGWEVGTIDLGPASGPTQDPLA